MAGPEWSWSAEELRKLVALRPRYCNWEGCDGRTVRERDYLMGSDGSDPDDYLPIRECADHAAVPDGRVYVNVLLNPMRLIVRERPSG